MLAAFDTPQGLKDAMIKEQKNIKTSESSNITRIVEKIQKEAFSRGESSQIESKIKSK